MQGKKEDKCESGRILIPDFIIVKRIEYLGMVEAEGLLPGKSINGFINSSNSIDFFRFKKCLII